MKALNVNSLKHRSIIALIVFSFMSFGLFSRPPHWAPAFGYHKKHHYVYYPKQNFYYDPFLGTYIVYEEGVWVRQVAPPRVFAQININILPHVDLFISSYRPYYYNDDHCRTYRLVTFIAPRNEFYIYRHPFRYDFSITPYYYYHPRHPHGPKHYAYYNPNYYYHPGHGKHNKHGKGHGHGYDMHDNYWVLKDDKHHGGHGNGHYKGHPDYNHGGGGKHGNHAPAPWGNPKSNGNGNGNKQKGGNQFPLNTPSNHGKQTDHSKIKRDLQKQQQHQQQPPQNHPKKGQSQKQNTDNRPVMVARDNNHGGGSPNGGNMKSKVPQQQSPQHGNGGGGNHGGGNQGGGKHGKK